MPAGALFVSISAPCVWPAMTSPAVLLVADLLHPIDGRAVQLFLDSDVAHGSGRAGAMSVLFAGREPDDVARADLLNGAALTLHQAEACHDNEGLTKRMRMPGGARAGLKGDERASNAGGLGRAEQGIDAHRASKPVGWAFAGRLRAAACDVHGESPLGAAREARPVVNKIGYGIAGDNLE